MLPAAGGRAAAWGGVFALSLGAFVLVAAEFMPVSLLTPIAASLQVSEGQAGQAIAASGAFAVLTSLFISSLAGRLDRKVLLLALTGLTLASSLVVAFAPNYPVFMVGRALVGVGIGGFWSMSAASAMRLVPPDQVPRALAIFNGGNALATVVAAPLGSFLGDLIGWRGAFFCIAPVATAVFVWQLVSLPAMESRPAPGPMKVFQLLRRPQVAWGMAAVGALFMGQFALFTYLRPFLETVTGLGVNGLSAMLLAIGLSGAAGTALIRGLLDRRLFRVLVVIPALMALIAGALIALGASVAAATVLLALWGLLATSAPVGWWTWLARSLPDEAEVGGGLMVAIVQLAITAGATVGGLLFDLSGHRLTFAASAAILLAASGLSTIAARQTREP